MNRRYFSCKTRFYFIFALVFLGSGPLFAQMPVNLDFGSGDFTNWKTWVGRSVTGDTITGAWFSDSMLSAPIGGTAPGGGTVGKSRHAIVSGSDTDFYGGFPIVCPAGGTYSLRLGNDSNLYRAERVQYFVQVPANAPSYNIQYQYAMVAQEAGHWRQDEAAFNVIAYDSATGAVIPTANGTYTAGANVPGFQPAVNYDSTRFNGPIHFLPWTPSTINLSGMAGRTVMLECTTLACTQQGHFAYAYFDVISVADTLQPIVLGYNATGDSVTFQAPPGYRTYGWFNQDFSLALSSDTNTARTVTLPVPGLNTYYNLVITPYASIGVADTIQTQVLRSNVGIASKALAAVRVYPNPVSAVLHLASPRPFDGSLQLLNAAGGCVYRREVSGEAHIEVPTAGLAAGMYHLILHDKMGGTEVRQVVIGR